MRRTLQAIIGISLLAIVGCAHMEPEVEYLTTDYPVPDRIGVYHKVQKGETIWRIAKTYDVSIQDIIRSNNIPSAAQVEENQLIFIPGATSVREIVIETEEEKKDFIWPLEGKVIRYFREHNGFFPSRGIDIKAPGGVPVHAARTGQVVFADFLSGYGYTVVLDHQDGFHSVYAHNAKLLVTVGDYVFKNTPIAHVGGRNELAYLHFQIRKDAVEDNPLFYLP